MVADLGQSPWVEQLPPAHDHGHGMNEQREAVADRAIKPEQQREREDKLGNAQGIRCLHRERYTVKAARDALGGVRENELLDAPLQQKNGEEETQDETARLECVCRFPATSDLSLIKVPVRAVPASTDRRPHHRCKPCRERSRSKRASAN